MNNEKRSTYLQTVEKNGPYEILIGTNQKLTVGNKGVVMRSPSGKTEFIEVKISVDHICFTTTPGVTELYDLKMKQWLKIGS